MNAVGYKLVSLAYYSCFAKGKYKLRYLPGTTVTAPGHTLGIMFFPVLNDALYFLKRCSKQKSKTRLLEVEFEYAKTGHPKYISNHYTEASLNVYYDVPHFYRSRRITNAFPGTAVAPSVKVLREIPIPIPKKGVLS